MKIAMINSVCGYGSTGRIMVELAKTYMQAGHDCILAYGRGKVSEDVKKQMEKEYPGQCVFYRIGGKLAKVNNYIHGLESRLLDNHGFSSRIATRQFIEWLQHKKPDVIHLHNLHGYYINVEILFQYIKRSNIKVIWTLHDCWSFTGHCSHYEYVKCGKWKTGCHHCPQKKEYPVSFCVDASTKNYDEKKRLFTGVKDMTIITPSEWLKKQVEQSFLKEYPVAVIANGVDQSVFCRRSEDALKEKKHMKMKCSQEKSGSDLKQNALQESPHVRQMIHGDGCPRKCQNTSTKDKRQKLHKYQVLGVASVWTQRKGLKYFASLAKRLPDNYEIVLIGLSQKQLDTLEQKKGAHEYLKKITGILRTESQQELADYYRKADVFVNPTLEDTFPTTNLEALSCGTPVVTFDTGGSPEAVYDAGGCVHEIMQSCRAVVTKGNTKQLCLAVRSICEMDEEKKEEQRLRCVKRAQDYKKEERYKDYLKLL